MKNNFYPVKPTPGNNQFDKAVINIVELLALRLKTNPGCYGNINNKAEILATIGLRKENWGPILLIRVK